jgi:hypothetical protein
MDKSLVEAIEWYAAGSAAFAALLVALDLGRKITGYAMVLFCTSSVAFIVYGLTDEEGALWTQNAILLCINLVGVYRYLIRKKPA